MIRISLLVVGRVFWVSPGQHRARARKRPPQRRQVSSLHRSPGLPTSIEPSGVTTRIVSAATGSTGLLDGPDGPGQFLNEADGACTLDIGAPVFVHRPHASFTETRRTGTEWRRSMTMTSGLRTLERGVCHHGQPLLRCPVRSVGWYFTTGTGKASGMFGETGLAVSTDELLRGSESLRSVTPTSAAIRLLRCGARRLHGTRQPR